MIVDSEKVENFIAEIAEEEIMSRYGLLADRDIDTKSGPQDFVTAADHAAEARLEKALRGLYPGAAFIGEEGVAADPDLVARLDRETGAFWIVDPLDGTRNFVHRQAEFGTIVALIEDGEMRQGWIYAIPDRGFATASKHDGAFWRGEKLPALCEKDGPLTGYRAIGTLAEPWKSRIVQPLRQKYETEPMRCSAYGYIHLIRGLRDFGLYSRCSPWDHAAGILMLREVGGRAVYLDNREPYVPRMTQGRPLLTTATEVDWNSISGAFGL